MIIGIQCGLCGWNAGAADEQAAKLATEWHMESVHGVSPVGADYLPLADAILEQWIADEAAKDAATDLVWLNTLTLQDAEFLMSLQILPT